LIRDAKAQDANALTAIAKAAKAHWDYPKSWLESWDADLTITAAFLKAAVVRVLVNDQDEPRAFFAATSEAGTWELDHAWVHPDDIGKGYGRLMLEDIAQRLSERSVFRLEILSDPFAAPFYEKMGAVKIADKPSNQPGRTLPLYELKWEHKKGLR
jgi:GNAT superfamily N-acetyltransferase